MKYVYINSTEDRILCTSPTPIDDLRLQTSVQEYAVPDEFDLKKEVEPSVFLEGFLTPTEFLERLNSDYSALRTAEYPPIGDQLDALWKGGDAATEMLARVQAVKDKYPKP